MRPISFRSSQLNPVPFTSQMQLRCFATFPNPKDDTEADMLKQLIKDKAASAGIKEEDFVKHFDELQDQNANNWESLIKNLSLQLLSADDPVRVLDIFEKNFITQHAE